MLTHGGHVALQGGGPGAADISVIAPQGHSSAVYLTAEECRELAVRLLALGCGCQPTRVIILSRRDRYNEIVCPVRPSANDSGPVREAAKKMSDDGA